MAKVGSIMGRALGVAITYVIIGALWSQMMKVINSPELGAFGVLAQIGIGLFVAILPFLAFAPELKGFLS